MDKTTTQSKRVTTRNTTSRVNVRYITVTAMLSAVAFILMFFDFSVPFMPAFIKMDLSELPALIGTFAMGPACGVFVCLIKNLIHLTITSTGGVGELSNFILGAAFVVPAGLIYKHKKNKSTAVAAALTGAICMAVLSVLTNLYIVYPVYYNFMPEETIIAAYQAIIPSMKSIAQCLVCFNMPFTFVKGLFSVIITMIVYKPLSPIIKGKN